MSVTKAARRAALVLAAGGSSRLGRPKQLLRLGDESLIHRSCRLACSAGFESLFVVTGEQDEQIRCELAESPAVVVRNSAWADGMSSSLRVGVQAVQMADVDVASLLILVCDQVSLTVELLEEMRVRADREPTRIVACEYAGRFGVPAIFPAACLAELTCLQGDKGARNFLREHAEAVSAVAFPEGINDIDSEEDARRFGLL